MRTTRNPPVVAIAVLLACVLSACASPPGSAPTASGSASPSSSAEPTPDPTGSTVPTPDPDPSLGAEDRANVRAAIESGDTAAIEAYFADPVNVIIMSSECCGDMFPSEAVAALAYVTDAPGPWNWSIPAATLDDWRANYYYGSLFTGDDITGVASDGTVVSFGIVGDGITTVLMGFEEGFTF